MELTFQYGKTNKPNKLKDVMRPDRKRSQQESGDYKGKKGRQLNSDYAEVTDNSANNSNQRWQPTLKLGIQDSRSQA